MNKRKIKILKKVLEKVFVRFKGAEKFIKKGYMRLALKKKYQ